MLISVLRKMTFLAVLILIVGDMNGLAGTIREVRVCPPSGGNNDVSFFYRMPEDSHGKGASRGAVSLLLLAPGFNGEGGCF